MKRTLILIIFGLLLNETSQGQLLSDQTPPAGAKINFHTKFDENLNEYAGSFKSNLKHKEKLNNFFAGSIYELQIMFKSGKLIFNDQLSAYLEKVLSKVLLNDPGLNDKIDLYVIKSTQVNAFTFVSGEVFITLGLLAQLENEAQLAYILAHEVSHYKLGHHVNSIIKANNSVNKTTGSTSINDEAEELLKYAFSRELEFEADSLGFAIMKSSPYQSSSCLGAMDVLQYSYLPFNEIPFDPYFLFADSVNIPKSAILDKVHEINFDSDKTEDERSTHPNIAKRRKSLDHLMNKSGNNNGAVYIVGKKEFLAVRDISRREVCEELLRDENAIMGFYNSYVLVKDKKDGLNQSLIAKGFYEIAMQKQYGAFFTNNDKDDYSEGEIEKAYHFFKELSNEQASFLALYQNYKVYEATKDQLHNRLSSELIKGILKEHAITLSDIRSYFVIAKKPVLVGDTTKDVAVDTTSEDNDSKYAKIRQRKNEVALTVDTTTAEPGVKFHIRLFKNLINDPDFVKIYTIEEDLYFKNKTVKTESNNVVTFGNKKVEINTASVEAKKVLVFCPIFGARIKSYTDILNLYDGQAQFSNDAAAMFSASPASADAMSFENLDLSGVEQYNNYCKVMNYVDEVLSKEGKYFPLSFGQMQEVNKNKDYSHIILTKLSKSKESRSNIGQAILCGIIAFPLLPAALIYIATKELKQRCAVIFIDTNTSRIVVEDYKVIENSKFKTPADYFSSFIKK